MPYSEMVDLDRSVFWTLKTYLKDVLTTVPLHLKSLYKTRVEVEITQQNYLLPWAWFSSV